MATSSRNRQNDKARAGLSKSKSFDRTSASPFTCIGKPYQFLTKRFAPKPNRVTENEDFRSLGFDSKQCLQYLEDSVKTWAKNRNIDYTLHLTGTFSKQVAVMYRFVKKNQGEDQLLNVDFDKNNKRFVFIESEQCEFPNSNVFYLPVAVLNHVTGKLRESLVMLFRNLYYRHGFMIPKDAWDFQYNLGLWEDNEDLQEDCSDGYRKWVEAYLRGHVSKLFEEISTKYDDLSYADLDYCLNLVKESTIGDVEKGVTAKRYERLCELIEQGFPLLCERRLDGFDYQPSMSGDYRFTNEDDNGEMITLERLCCLTYGDEDNDPIVESSIDVLNSDCYNYAEFTMYDVHALRPTDTEIWHASDFPARFNDWYSKIYTVLDEYEPRDLPNKQNDSDDM